MSVFATMAVLVTLTALFAYFNERSLRLPTPVGVMLGALLASLSLVLFGGAGLQHWAQAVLDSLAFGELFTQGMLSFLLFAGALHVNLGDLAGQKWPILVLATLGVAISTILTGTLVHVVLALVGVEIPWNAALLFGALISPTDPIAVLGILRKARVPKDLETLITGESLFNDGVGVVAFAVVLGLTAGGGHSSSGLTTAALLLLREAVGGVAFGLVVGFLAFRMLKSVDNYSVEVLITLAVVSGGYALAQQLHTSGPIAMVVAGLLIGNHGRLLAMSERTRERLDTFWEMTDEILNAVLFLLIGMEVLVIKLTGRSLEGAAIAVPLVLVSRFVSVGLLIRGMGLLHTFPPRTVRLMTWGGLRGGVSVALALAVPVAAGRELILAMTYGVVVFSIVVQGLTIGRVTRGLAAAPPEHAS
jgi:monovalent cation:H+ antiporter, CPA1 family